MSVGVRGERVVMALVSGGGRGLGKENYERARYKVCDKEGRERRQGKGGDDNMQQTYSSLGLSKITQKLVSLKA